MAKITWIALAGTASLMTIAACARESVSIAPEGEAAADARAQLHASVVENAREVMQASLVDLSRALPPMVAPAEPEGGQQLASAASGIGADAPSLTIDDDRAQPKASEPGTGESRAKAAPAESTPAEPTDEFGRAPPRSAAEAAERGDAGAVPKAVSPTAPAETTHPLEDER